MFTSVARSTAALLRGTAAKVPATGAPIAFRAFSVSVSINKDASTTTTATKKKKTTTAKKTDAAKKEAAPKKKKSAAPKKMEPTPTQLRAAEMKKTKPTKPAFGFSLYLKEKFANIYRETQSLAETTRLLAEAWKKEPESVKAEYLHKDPQEFALYKAKKEEWTKKYKKPLNGYTKYIKHSFLQSPVSNLEQGTERMKALAASWKELSNEEKEAWKNREI